MRGIAAPRFVLSTSTCWNLVLGISLVLGAWVLELHYAFQENQASGAVSFQSLYTKMNAFPSPALPRVASLHLHPVEPGTPLQAVQSIEVVPSKGILGEPRYFGRLSKSGDGPNPREITLIEREQIAQHAAALGLQTIQPGAVRSNIETLGIDLIGLIGSEIQIGSAVLSIYGHRDPCAKMDAICQGLRERMKDKRQGVLAQIVRSGTIKVGDAIEVISRASAHVAA